MTKPLHQDRPVKPQNCPLRPHACGQWVKQIGGKLRFFGKWSDLDAALERYRREFPYLNLGLQPPAESLTLADVLNAYNDDKTALLESGRIIQRTYDEY